MRFISLFLVSISLPIFSSLTAKTIIHSSSPAEVISTWSETSSIALPKAQIAEGSEPTNRHWMTVAEDDLKRREYFVSETEQGIQAPNRALGIRSYFSLNGLRVVSREESSQSLMGLQFQGISRQNVINIETSVKAKSLRYEANRVYIDHGKGIEEWYVNSDLGVEHGFNLSERSAGEGRLNIYLNVTDGTIIEQGSGLAIQLLDGRNMAYDKLMVLDANKDVVPASLIALDENRIAIQLDDSNALYPLWVDPLISSNQASVQLDSNQASSHFGESVASAGDVNGDGFDDVIVGAKFYDNGESNEGAAFIYYGSSEGLIPSFSAILESNQIDAEFGYSVASAGDINSDGYDDVLVGSRGYDNTEMNTGAVYVYYGSVSGISTSADVRIESDRAYGYLGSSVAGAGDIDNDGFDDIILGAYTYTNNESNEGAAFIYFGDVSGLKTTGFITLELDQPEAHFGSSVAGVGDVNNDGFDDVIVGAIFYENGQSNQGAAFVYYGSGLDSTFDSTVDVTFEADQAGAYYGWSVASAGDVNNDGISDIIVGAWQYSNIDVNLSEGAAFIYFGIEQNSNFNLSADVILTSDKSYSQFGRSVASAGDFNSDGYDDIIVGAPAYDGTPHNYEGAAFIYYGSESGLTNIADVTLEVNQAHEQFGISTANAGDVNGDGVSDLIIGSRFYDSGLPYEGAAFIYYGSGTNPVSSSDATLEYNQNDSDYGWSVASAGDINNDGFDDVIIGAKRYDNGEFNEGAAFVYHGSETGLSLIADALLESNQGGDSLGSSVASAGDVNGDGYDDVIVGAENYANGESFEGASFVYYGSDSGLSSSASVQMESDQAEASFGYSVAGAGDVNSDGFDDVIVGSYRYDNGQNDEGAAFVYYGSAAGLSSSVDLILESNQDNAQFGFSVSAAGDVNDDGYADVVIGANNYNNGESNEGAAFIYYGSVVGLNSTADVTLESNIENAHYASSVAYAGDVNSDDIDDLIVGAPSIGPGTVFIYYGSIAGPESSASITLESTQSGASFGQSIASAGDLNADGYDDVIIGATHYQNGETSEGAAFISYGSSTGPSNGTYLILESNQSNSNFGFSVAGAGDINGDGFDDVVVGANRYDLGESDEGVAFIYYGSLTTLKDSDGDGITDDEEVRLGTDIYKLDSDDDGLSDLDEINFGSDPTVADTDNDGLTDQQEYYLGTNPILTDTDGDGVDDKFEVDNNLNPLVEDCPNWLCGSSKVWLWKLLKDKQTQSTP